MSRLRAALFGDEWLGYSAEVAGLYDVYDVAGLQLQAARRSRRLSTKHFKERPSVRPPQAKSLDTFNFGALAAQINS